MKNILFYSPDLNFCASMLMLFQDKYHVTATTALETVKKISEIERFDLVVLDSEPDTTISELCVKLHEKNNALPIILIYVFKGKFKEAEEEIREKVAAIFYKPINLIEVSKTIDKLLYKYTLSD